MTPLRNRFVAATLRLLIAIALCQGCASDTHSPSPQVAPSGPRYFRRWRTYQLPHVPVDEIPRDTAVALGAYVEAYYDTAGRVIRFTKYLNGKADIRVAYFYRRDGTPEVAFTIDPDGQEKVLRFPGGSPAPLDTQ